MERILIINGRLTHETVQVFSDTVYALCSQSREHIKPLLELLDKFQKNDMEIRTFAVNQYNKAKAMPKINQQLSLF